MTEAQGIGLEAFRVLVQRAGLNLNEAELGALKPMFDFYAEQLQKLHDVDLGVEDPAVAFLPGWDPQS